MNTKMKLRVSATVIVICSLFIASRVQAIRDGPSKDTASPNSQMINPRPGPEADPYLRHCPGCYDFENESAPIDTLP